LVQNVRSNEELYETLDFAFDEEYELVRDAAQKDIVKGGLFQRRIVFQPGRYFGEELRRSSSVAGARDRTRQTESYDGQVTRQIFENPGGTIVNIHKGFVVQSTIYRPHTLLLTRAFIGRKTLTEYLTSEKLDERGRHRVFVEGEETVNGLRCTHVRSERGVGEPSVSGTIRHIWLAQDRNYIPVKTVGLALGYSSTIPLEEREVSEFQELAPGVWCPRAARYDVYYEIDASEGRKVLSNRAQLKVTKAVLDPRHDDAFFRDVEIPPRALIYEIENGKVTRDYRQADPPPPSRWWLWTLLCAVLLCALAFGWKRYRNR